MDRDRPVVVLLLPERLEDYAHRALAEDVMRTDGVVAVDPARVGYDKQAAWPEPLGVMLAQRQAKRLRKKLPGTPKALAIFHPGQYLLARSLVAQLPGCELWYGPLGRGEEAPDSRLEELHLLARERASLLFEADGEALRAHTAEVLGG